MPVFSFLINSSLFPIQTQSWATNIPPRPASLGCGLRLL